MRIWSIHPKYLDAKGLVALWRETLLAKHVLEGKTKGYRNHPQLDRFKLTNNPKDAINQYLSAVFDEACTRGYKFDRKKINWDFEIASMVVTSGQIKYEAVHLLNKLKKRDKAKFKELNKMSRFKPHPMFKTVRGKIEEWEIVQ
jgi:Pyrimidine dimer DNA glycosylase